MTFIYDESGALRDVFRLPTKTESVCPECSAHVHHAALDELLSVWCPACWESWDESQKQAAVGAQGPLEQLAVWRRYVSLTPKARMQVAEPGFPCPEELYEDEERAREQDRVYALRHSLTGIPVTDRLWERG